MKIIMEFNLPEEESNYRWARDGFAYLNIIKDFNEYLRRVVKYEENKIFHAQEIREKFFEIVRAHDVSIE